MQIRIIFSLLFLFSFSLKASTAIDSLEAANRVINNDKLRKAESLTQFIDKYKEEVEKKYKENYPGIFNTDLKAFSLEVLNFKAITNTDLKLKTGKELISKLKMFDLSFAEFKKIDTVLAKTYPRVETIYKSTYRSLYKNEISPLKEKIAEYNREDTLSQKLESGKILNIQVLNLLDMYPVFQKIDTSVAKKFPIVKKRYEDVFPLIYKKEINPVSAEIEFYNELKIVSEKLSFGQDLDEKLKTFDLNFNELIQQEKEIKEKHEAFEKAYAKNKPNKYVYKRGADLYDNSLEDYKNQATIKTKKRKRRQYHPCFRQTNISFLFRQYCFNKKSEKS